MPLGTSWKALVLSCAAYDLGAGHAVEIELEQPVTVDTAFVSRLYAACPELTEAEVRICVLPRGLGDDSREIARRLQVTLRTVQTQRGRIRMKLGLCRDESFVAFIEGLNLRKAPLYVGCK
jgi:DNA-binding CsgD family transcriptional regulator